MPFISNIFALNTHCSTLTALGPTNIPRHTPGLLQHKFPRSLNLTPLTAYPSAQPSPPHPSSAPFSAASIARLLPTLPSACPPPPPPLLIRLQQLL
eukprot:1148880-Pelagomonas_calceolata.AAC.2